MITKELVLQLDEVPVQLENLSLVLLLLIVIMRLPISLRVEMDKLSQDLNMLYGK